MLRYKHMLMIVLALICSTSIGLSEDKATAALDKITSVQCKDVPLKDLATYLADKHGIVFVLSPAVKGDTPITCLYKDVKLRAALDGVLRQLKLGFRVKDGMVLIEPLPAT